MKKIALLIFLLPSFAGSCWAQGVSGNLTAQSTDCTTTNACIEIDIPQNVGAATLKLSGTFSATAQFEASGDPISVTLASANWVALNATPSNSTTAATSATTTGVWQANVSGYQRIRIRISSFISGTVAAAINLSNSSARSGGGGGGTIGGSIAANQVAVGSGANAIRGSANFTADASSQVTLTSAGNSDFPLIINGAAGGGQLKPLLTLNPAQSTANCNTDPVVGGLFAECIYANLPLYMQGSGPTIDFVDSNAFAHESLFGMSLGAAEMDFFNCGGTTALCSGLNFNADGSVQVGLDASKSNPVFILTSAAGGSSGALQMQGQTSGSATISVAAVAGTPNKILLPTATGTSGQVLQTDGNNPQQTSWTTPTALSCSYQSPLGAVTGTAAAATYYTCSVPALAASTGISIIAVSKHTTGTAAVSYTVQFGGTSTTNSQPAGSANQIEVIRCLLMNNNGSTSAQTVTTQFEDSNAGTITTTLNTMAINTTTAQTLNIQFNVANTDQITPEQFLVQLVQ